MGRIKISKEIQPTLESITIKGKYKISLTNFEAILTEIQKTLSAWFRYKKIGDSIRLIDWTNISEKWGDLIKRQRPGVPIDFSIVAIEYFPDGILVEVQCLPCMWHQIVQGIRSTFSENQVQEALLECGLFIKQIMSIFKGKEIEPASVYPVIPRREIRTRLLNLGLKEVVEKIDRAERHIIQNNFVDSLKASRTAFEKTIDWQMIKRGLEKTSNYQNDLDRLRSKGYLDVETTKMLQGYYRCISNIGVHERGMPVGVFEAQMVYGMTLIIMDYFINKLP